MNNEVIIDSGKSAGKSYKEQQKFYKNLARSKGKILWVSKDPTNPLAKGKTYIKKDDKNGNHIVENN